MSNYIQVPAKDCLPCCFYEGCAVDGVCSSVPNRSHIESATEQKAIDDEEYHKDMRYIGVKQEELIDKVLDTTIQYLQDHLIDVVLVGGDKQSGAWGYRILDERIREEVKKRLK